MNKIKMQAVPTSSSDEADDDIELNTLDSGEESVEESNDRQRAAVERYHDEDSDDVDDDDHDDDEDDDRSYDDFVGNDTEAGTRHRKLKSMGIMLGEDFISAQNGAKSCGRYWYLWLCLSVAVVSGVLLVEGSVNYHKHVALLAGYGENGDSYNAAECRVYDKQALQAIEQQFATPDATNNTATLFCQENQLDNCTCKHPFIPAKPDTHNTKWAEIETMNVAMVDKFTKHISPDVVLLGDDITEHWNGLDLGYTNGDSSWRSIKKVFDHLFNKQNGGKVNGVALGIAGDRISNLLYRLGNGEGPKSFHPKVWWVLIGANDLQDNCNADAIVVGNFRIVEEIRRYHPGAIIVINSILPRNENPDDLWASPTWPIIRDINLKLQCYANTVRGVEFFNATDVFLAHRKGKEVVNMNFMKDAVHPNAEGSRLWGEAIVDRVLEIKGKMQHHEQYNKHHGNK